MARELILNRYRPIGQAGKGGFATVQVAWDTRIQRKVAIKTIELDESEALAFAARSNADAYGNDFDFYDDQADGSFDDAPPWDDAADAMSGANAPSLEHVLANLPGIDEARTAAMLSDAHIVQVYDFEVRDFTAYLIMEYIEGMTLTELLRDHDDEISLDIIAALFEDVAHALQVAHGNQVLHLDIKPDNIIINRQGQVKVTDFGLATLADAQGCGTANGGTIGYMPPEQIRQEALDARCDEWALASMTYQAISGSNPFLTRSLDQAVERIEQAELVLPSLLWDELDDKADDVLFKALDPSRTERYPSVERFAKDLQPLLGDARLGRKQLGEIVGGASEEEPEAEQPLAERIPLRERITATTVATASRVFACICVGVLLFNALGSIELLGGFTGPATWGVLAICLIATAFKPHAGALLGFEALAVTLLMHGQYVLGAAFAAVTFVWWWLAGRHGNAAANATLSLPLFGGFSAFSCSIAASGYSLPARQTAINVVYGSLVCLVLASVSPLAEPSLLVGWNIFDGFAHVGSAQTAFLALCTLPRTWILIGGWLVGATAMSLGCDSGRRWLAIGGACVCAALMIASTCIAAAYFTSATVLASRIGSYLVAQAPAIAASVVAGAGAVAACCVHIPGITPWGPTEVAADEAAAAPAE